MDKKKNQELLKEFRFCNESERLISKYDENLWNFIIKNLESVQEYESLGEYALGPVPSLDMSFNFSQAQSYNSHTLKDLNDNKLIFKNYDDGSFDIIYWPHQFAIVISYEMPRPNVADPDSPDYYDSLVIKGYSNIENFLRGMKIISEEELRSFIEILVVKMKRIAQDYQNFIKLQDLKNKTMFFEIVGRA